jgi:two-component system nitrate/nitrite response regulator NarL
VSAEDATVVLADDHVPMREAVAEVLTGGGFRVVGQAGDGPGAVSLVKRRRPDVCVLDINMPGGGIEAAGTIASTFPDTSVVMLTVHVDDDHLFDALRVGASGYLVKGTDPDEMVASLRALLRGEPALSSGLAMRMLERFRGTGSRRVPVPQRGIVELSPREAEVLDLLRQGLTTSLIAQRLYVSPVTVRSHIAAVLKKLNAPDREAAIRLFDA